MRQEFTFNGMHCDAYNVAFIADHWPMAAASTPNKVFVSGRHGSLRYKGKTYGEMVFSGTLYLLDADNQVITYHEMLERANTLAGWLCKDGRHPLILDAMPDKFYMAEVEAEISVDTLSWGNGSIPVTFTLQPFTYAIMENTARTSLTAAASKDVDFMLVGNQSAPIGVEVTATATVVNQCTITLGTHMLRFADLNLRNGQTLRVDYDLEIGEIMRIMVNGQPGAGYLQPESKVPFEAVPGINKLTLLSSGACDMAIFARGRW